MRRFSGWKPYLRLALAVQIAIGLSVALLPTTVREAGPPPVVTLYGQSGTFGKLTNLTHLPSGQSLQAQPIPSWGITPGQTFFNSSAGNGIIFFAGFSQSGDDLYPTADHMDISEFDPSTGIFRNNVIPTSKGALHVVDPWNGVVGGADVADTQLMTVNGVQKLAFISNAPYHRWSIQKYGLYPQLGYLAQQHGQWGYDKTDSLSAQQLQDINGPGGPTGRSSQPCPTYSDPYSEPTASCQGMSDMALLPRSNDLVIAHYFGGPNSGIFVFSPDGKLKGTYTIPAIPAPPGASWYAAAKFVEADPTSKLGDERFFVEYDVYYTPAQGKVTWSYPVQEYSFDATQPNATKAIHPVTAALIGDPEGNGYSYGNYDSHGNMWIGENIPGDWGFNGGDMAIFPKDPVTGKRSYESGPCAVPANFPQSGWEIACEPDVRVAGKASDGYATGIVEDTLGGTPNTGVMYVTTIHGKVIPIIPTYDASDRLTGGVRKTVIDVDVGGLPSKPGEYVQPDKAEIDPASRSLWVPTSTGYLNYTTHKPVQLPQWAYRIDLNQAVQ